MVVPDHQILHFQYLKVELKRNNWRQFIHSDNPVAAALLAKMGYNEKERRELRMAYLRMILRLQGRLDNAQLALIMSVADLYFIPDPVEDQEIILELSRNYPEEGEQMMELMPAWKRWGYEEGREEGRQEGREEGREEGTQAMIQKMLSKGFAPEVIADTFEISVDEVKKAMQSPS